jgi:ElaB/YqjD/DUF883 family membrane-anchored ribosome-binding protein
MGRTIDAIQTRLDPDRLKHQAQSALREATIGKVEDMAETTTRQVNNWRSNLIKTVRDNPVPAALVGLGLGWLFMEGNKDDHYTNGDYPYYDRPYSRYTYASDSENNFTRQAGRTARQLKDKTNEAVHNAENTVSDVAHKAGEAVQDLGERAGNVVDRVQNSAEELAQQAQMGAQHLGDEVQQQARYLRRQTAYQGRRAKSSFQQLLQENPLAVGAAVLAIGAMVGLSLPGTEQEDELMGETRDDLVHRAQDVVKETTDKVRHVAEEAQRAGVEATKEAVKTTQEAAKNEVERQNLTDMAKS